MEKKIGFVVAIVLNYNSTKDTKKCISYLQKQDYKDFHIVVVDNHSPEREQVEELKEFCKEQEIDLILSDANNGFSAGNNIGIRKAIELHAEWVLIINPDVEIRDAHYISHVIGEVKKWSGVGVVASKILLPTGVNQNPMRELTASEEILFPLEIFKQRLGKGTCYKTEEVTGYCEKVSGCCFFANVDFLEKNNLLDEHVFMYCEEPILAKSLIWKGYKALYIDEIEAYHQHINSEKPGNKSKRMIAFLNSRKYYIKNYSGYSIFGKLLAIFARNIQILIWKVKK